MLFSYRTLFKPVSRLNLQVSSSSRPKPQFNRPRILGRVVTMASKTAIASVDKITIDEFNQLLGQYPALIKDISSTKSAKPGQKTLEALDEYRYNDALDMFSPGKDTRPMKLDDIKTLVEWKLRHGKFRPTLMKLVSSNDADTAEDIVKQAIDAYKEDTNIDAALNVLTKLKGIGPATASLLLAVHDANRVIFFADEAFWWLCCDGKQSPIKYNAKEYRSLCSAVNDLHERLDVAASDVERVAYVLMKGPASPKPSDHVVPSKEAKKNRAPSSTKRKPDTRVEKADDATHDAPVLRRSKRVKA
ncbi:hypothetical protein NW759_000316 [Fusarium solani]|nr:hypothetical protein NW759_000316 [Fusarium solani]